MITLKKRFTDITNFVFKKKVIVRVDLNLPFYEDKVSDYTRLEKIIPTLDFLLQNNSKIILISHFGRPNGEKEKELSLELIKDEIQKFLKKEIYFCADNLKTIKRDKINKILERNDIILLENIRFYPEEESNDEVFAKKIAMP